MPFSGSFPDRGAASCWIRPGSSKSKYMAMTHFCSGTLLDCMTVPVLTLKYSRHSPPVIRHRVSFFTADVFRDRSEGK